MSPTIDEPSLPWSISSNGAAPRQSEIALLNGSKAWSARDFAFISRAIEIQVVRDFMPAWRGAIEAFGFQWMPPVAYSSTDGLPAGSFAPLSVLDDIEEAGALGFHDWELESWGRSKPDSVTLSHEVLELLADPKCDGWCVGPRGVIAREVCDPVESQHYGIDVALGDETRTIQVSNFVTPRYFEMAFSAQQTQGYDFMGIAQAPFANLGYQITKLPDGTVSNVFASTDRVLRAKVDAKGWWSRTGRRLGLTP